MHDRADRDLDRHLGAVRAAPRDEGRLLLIVRRPARDEREVVAEAMLSLEEGLVGDDWRARGSRARMDGSADPDAQLTLMSTRVLAAISPDASRWPLAGDQLLVDLDLSAANLPPGTRLAIGDAEIELTPPPHTGCSKFSERFGSDAQAWVNSPAGRTLRLRGANARIVRGGTIRSGDAIRKV
jgi:MOSC domain-containing protein YiiM